MPRTTVHVVGAKSSQLDDSSSSKSGTLQLEGEWHADCNMAVAPVQLAISSDALPALLQATVDLAEEWKRKQVRRASNQIRVASLKYVQYVLIMYGQACACVSFRYTTHPLCISAEQRA